MNLFIKIFDRLWVFVLWVVISLGLVGLFFTPSWLPKLDPFTNMLMFMWAGSQFLIIDLKRKLKTAEDLSDYMVGLYK